MSKSKKIIVSSAVIVFCLISFFYWYGTKDDVAVVPTSEPSSSETQAATEKATTLTSESKNELISKVPNFEYVKNANGDKNGMRGFIKITKDEIKNVTQDEFKDFIKERVKDPKFTYMWYTIAFDDGTGIVFTGANESILDYGKLDALLRVEQVDGYIKLNGETYEFVKK